MDAVAASVRARGLRRDVPARVAAARVSLRRLSKSGASPFAVIRGVRCPRKSYGAGGRAFQEERPSSFWNPDDRCVSLGGLPYDTALSHPLTAELVFWRREQDALARGVEQLRQLELRARADPEFARSVVADLSAAELESFVDERDMIPDDCTIAAAYYAGLVAEYERRLLAARGNGWVDRAHQSRPRLASPRRRPPRGRRRERRRTTARRARCRSPGREPTRPRRGKPLEERSP